jgi:chromosome segregation ATPase
VDQDRPDQAASLRELTLRNTAFRTLLGARRIVSDRIKRLIDYRINERIPLDRLEHYYAKIDRLAEEHHESVGDLRGRFDELTRRCDEVERLQKWTANELERIIPQVGAQESQLESLRDKIDAVPAADRPQIDEARSLIDEIRREHMQIRVRLTAVAQYEERLRKLEDRTE